MKKLILLCALCLFGAGVVFGQAYSDLLYRDWAGLRAYAQVNKTLGDVRPTWFSWVTPSPRGGSTSTRSSFRKQLPGPRHRRADLVGNAGALPPDVIELHPQCVAIMAGTNDIAMNNGYIALENTYQNIVSMCELARFNGIKVLLCSVTPCVRYNWRPQVEPGKIIPKLNAMLRKYADSAEGVEYVDYFSAMADKDNAMLPEYSPEGCHPNGEGYKVMEKIIVSAINKVNGTDKNYFVY